MNPHARRRPAKTYTFSYRTLDLLTLLATRFYSGNKSKTLAAAVEALAREHGIDPEEAAGYAARQPEEAP